MVRVLWALVDLLDEDADFDSEHEREEEQEQEERQGWRPNSATIQPLSEAM